MGDHGAGRARPADGSALDAASGARIQAGVRASAPDAPCVLVIEDERLIRDLIVDHLTDEGFVPQEAGSIAEARVQLAAGRPSLIMLDLMLPGESGWDFLRARTADPLLAPIPVLVVSAAPPDRLLEAKQLGADAFLSKPFDLDALSALVHNFVR